MLLTTEKKYKTSKESEIQNEKAAPKRLPKGYDFQGIEKDLQKASNETSLLISAGVALSDWVLIFLSMLFGLWIHTNFGFSTTIIFVHIFLIFPVCARALRGKENLVHEASHSNFHRRSRKINDMVGDWFCAYWVLLSVVSYRLTHTKHHAYFGSDDDPDKLRFERLEIDEMPRRNIYALMKYLVGVFPTYWIDYWKQFSGKAGQFVWSVSLHVALAGTISYFYPGFWLLWLIYWWIPFIFYLPVIRFFAEAEKHRYKDAQSEYESTFSNLGFVQKWFLHPHGDAYHLLHHLSPQIPHWRMSTLHWAFSAVNNKFREGAVRKSVFESTNGTDETK